NDAKEILGGLREQLKIILPLITETFIDWAKGIWESVTGWFTELWNDLIGNSIITDMISDIIGAFTGIGAKISEKIQEGIELISGVFTGAKQGIIDAAGGISTGVTESMGAISEAASNFTLSNMIDGAQEAKEVLAELAGEGLTSVEGFVSDAASAFVGVDLSAEVGTMFEPFHTALDAIKDIDVGQTISGISTSIGESVAGIQTSLLSMFEGVDLSLAASNLAIGAGGPIAGLLALSEETSQGIKETLSKMFEGIDLSQSIEELKTTITTGIGGFVSSAMDGISTFATDFVNEILSIPTKIKERISEFTDVGGLLKSAFGFDKEDITGDIAGELKAGESDIVAPVESTTEKIKGAWSDAYDWVVGGSVVPDMVTGVIDQFVTMSTTTLPTVTGLTLAIQKAFSDMSLAVIQSMSNMSLMIYTNTFGTNLLIAESYLLMTQQVNTHMAGMQTNTSVVLNSIRPMWLSSFAAIMNTTRAFGAVGKQVLTAIDSAVKKLTESVKKLKTGIGDVKSILDELAGTDIKELNDAFK
ncbi:hypothetical protein LCGC14_2412130, partial [marine sediment metagenome]